MKITEQTIALKYRKSVVLTARPYGDGADSGYTPTSVTLAMEMLQLGFIASKDLLKSLVRVEASDRKGLAIKLLNALREMKGANVEHKPMYPNFPKQVAEASDIELFLNAIVHYWTNGVWSPKYNVLPREYADDAILLIEIGVIDST